MRNKYLLFCAVYRYQPQFDKIRKDDEVAHCFSKPVVFTDMAMKTMISKRLEYNYDVVDEESCFVFLDDLKAQRLITQPFFSVLVDLWQTKKDLMFQKDISFEDLSLTDSYLLSQIHHYEQELEAEDEEFFMQALKDQLNDLAVDPDGFPTMFGILDQYADLVNMAYPFLYWGYDIARYIEVIRESYEVGYLTKEQANEQIDELALSVEKRFTSWEQFLASCLVGKCFKSGGKLFSNNDILNINDYVKNIYDLIQSPNNILMSSGIWPNSNLNQLAFKLERAFDLKPNKVADALAEYGVNVQLKTKSVTLAYEKLFKPLEDAGLSLLFQGEKQTDHFYYAVAESDEDVLFWKRFHTLKEDYELFFSKNEIPLFIFGSFYLTNKAMYYTKRSLFRKKLITTPIADLEYRIVPHIDSFSFTLYVNSSKMLLMKLAKFSDLAADLNAGDRYALEQKFIKECKIVNDILNQLVSI